MITENYCPMRLKKKMNLFFKEDLKKWSYEIDD